MQNINSSIYKYGKLGIFLTLNGQFAYLQSSRLKHILLCGLQPSPGMIYCGDLLTEIGLKHVADSFLKTFIEDVRDPLPLFALR